MSGHIRKPEWIRTKLPSGERFKTISQSSRAAGLATICEEAKCPNQWECWKSGTATFMLMGDTCTRSCRFCSVKTAKKPSLPDPDEPTKLAAVILSLNLKYAVLTTVDRDDLPDLGLGHIIQCVNEIKAANPAILIELLIPDFQGRPELIAEIAACQAEVIGHNLECTRSLTRLVRDPRASYDQSLQVLRIISQHHPGVITKSSLMLGFGETESEVLEAMNDLKQAGVKILTLGQYLQPGKRNIPVKEYVHPDTFAKYQTEGLRIGFEYVASGPLVRSSYLAGEHYLKLKLSQKHLAL